MALNFGKTQGKAGKSVDALELKDGDNVVRLVGGVLARYIYWLKNKDNKNIAVECLAFDRDLEKFTNVERDVVQERDPAARCSWAYAIQCIEFPGTPEARIRTFNLKKKLFQAILTAAEDLGDPTDPETGWDVHFKKSKTGAKAFDVEYTLQQLRCKVRPLTELERKLVAEMKDIDQVYPRQKVEDIERILDTLDGDGAGSGEKLPAEMSGENDDVPY